MSVYVRLSSLALVYGKENLRIFYLGTKLERCGPFAFTSSSNNREIIEGRIADDSHYPVENDHKFRVTPLDSYYAYETYYNSDFESLCRDGRLGMKVMRGDEILPLHIVDNIPSTLRADFIEYYAKAVHERSYESLWEAVYSHTSENWAEDRERLSQLDDIRRTLGMEVKYPETMETEA